MAIMTNAKVTTPIGQGICQGGFTIVEGEQGTLVRLPVNEQTAQHLNDSNCITPRAETSGLWVFPQSQIGQALVEYALILALVAGIILIVCNTWPW